jgi:hypothetical protein
MAAVQATRKALRSADETDLASVFELRDLHRPLNEIFRELYTLTDPISEPPALRGSCPVGRSRGSESHSFVEPELLTLGTVEDRPSDLLESFARRYADESGRCWIVFDRPAEARRRARWLEELRKVLWRLAAVGIAEFAIPDIGVSPADWQQVAAYSPCGFVARADIAHGDAPHSRPMPLRRFTLSYDTGRDGVATIMSINRPLHIIAVPSTASEPGSPDRLLSATRRHALWSDFVAEFEA